MSLFSSVLEFAKADLEGKGIPVLISLLQALQNAKTAPARAAAVLQFDGNAIAAGFTIGEDILQDMLTTAQAELQSLLPKTPPHA